MGGKNKTGKVAIEGEVSAVSIYLYGNQFDDNLYHYLYKLFYEDIKKYEKVTMVVTYKKSACLLIKTSWV